MPRVHEPLEVTLRRLKDERLEADRLYHDALTALDQALRSAPDLPDIPESLDDHQIAALNDAWNVAAAAPPQEGGVRGWVGAIAWKIVQPYLERQRTFNSWLVDHINRNAEAARRQHRALQDVTSAVRQHVAALIEFRMRLILYLQQITLYVDTKDRDAAGGALVLNAALSGATEEFAKRWESLKSRDQRFDTRVAALSAAHDELRAMIGVTQQAALTLKRELERQGAGLGAEARSAKAAEPGDAFSSPLDAYKYVGFEDQFRGSRDVIRERLESYLPYFDGLSDVLDVGCGRGEFLDLLSGRGIAARGIDLNHEMAEACRARGLDVTEADAVGYLSSLDDASLGGIFAAQVVEHLEPGYLLRFLELAYHKLRPGGRLVLETLNPACWVAFFESYIRDITHVWPLHPETLRYLITASGFTQATIEYRSAVPPQDRLQSVVPAGSADSAAADIVETFNANVEKLNARMFTHMDYAVVARK